MWTCHLSCTEARQLSTHASRNAPKAIQVQLTSYLSLQLQSLSYLGKHFICVVAEEGTKALSIGRI